MLFQYNIFWTGRYIILLVMLIIIIVDNIVTADFDQQILVGSPILD